MADVGGSGGGGIGGGGGMQLMLNPVDVVGVATYTPHDERHRHWNLERRNGVQRTPSCRQNRRSSTSTTCSRLSHRRTAGVAPAAVDASLSSPAQPPPALL